MINNGKIAGICFIILLCSVCSAQNFSYIQSFESSNPFKFWTSNATYTINYFGLSSDRSVDGTKSLKMDITVNGSGTKDCYYYWTAPVVTNLIGQMQFSAHLYMNSDAANYVFLGYHYAFPPSGLERTPVPPKTTQFNTWFNQKTELDEDAIYHADYFAQNKIYGSTYDDFGRELKYLQLMIKARGSHRIVFYIDKIEIKGTVLTPTTYKNNYTSAWAAFQTRLASQVSNKHSEDNALPPIPSLTGIVLSALGNKYYNDLKNCDTQISSSFTKIDGKAYFDPLVMSNLEYNLGQYPSIYKLLNIELTKPSLNGVLFKLAPTVYNRLTGSNIPEYIEEATKLNARVCKGEFEPFSLFIQAKSNLTNIKVAVTNLTGSGTIPSSAFDVRIAKVWYQNGYAIQGRDGKWLTQELLIKNDNLIKVDETAQTNSLLVTRTDGSTFYTNISSPTSKVPANVRILDSSTLLPFNLPVNRNKQLWITLKVPDNAAPGNYRGTITITSDQGTLGSVPVEITVLPFNLDAPKLDYGIYYHGYVDDSNWSLAPFTSFVKSSSQLQKEMQDMKDHGILYPTTYQSLTSLGKDLTIRNNVGLPKDRLFTVGLTTGNPTSVSALNNLKNQVTSWKNKMASYGYSNLYVYGIDEATGTELISQRPAWQAVHDAGAKVFTAGYYTNFEDVGDLLDCALIQNLPRIEQADLYHGVNHKIYSYRIPMVGVEDPEIFRRNYGVLLFKAKYDGVMNYAYQRNYKDIWNDFDIESNQPHPYRDHVFSYPVTNGVINTIQFEGFREAVDDMRYLATLQNKMAAAKSGGKDISSYQSFLDNLDPGGNLDDIRSSVIDLILELNSFAKEWEGNEDISKMTDFKLEQNYPNPFNPSTIIKFSIPRKTFVKIDIFNILSEKVTTLINEEKEPGDYQVIFNSSEMNIASGIYIYKLSTKYFKTSKKMLLIK